MPDSQVTLQREAAACPDALASPTRNEKTDSDSVGRGIMVFVVALFVLTGHLWSVNTGLYLDDHAHYEHLIDGDWSYSSAVDAARLGIVGEVLDLWGRQEAGLRFFRPIAFWIMRAEYTICGWQPLPMHFFSLGWHFTCSMLIGVVAMRCLGRRFWAIVAAGLAAIHPVHVGSVYWIACQTELLTTIFLLLGLLAYSRHAAWGWRPGGVDQRGRPVGRLGPWFGGFERVLETVDSAASSREEGTGGGANYLSPRRAGTSALGRHEGQSLLGSAPEGSTVVAVNSGGRPCGLVRLRAVTWWGIAAVVCYALALGCRENAVFFPVVCWIGDWLCGSPRRRFRWEHAAMAAVLAVYLVLRHDALGGFPLPPPPYLVPFSADWAFCEYILYKIVMYTLGLFCFVPVIPIGSRFFFEDRPLLFYSAFTIAVGVFVAIWAAHRFRRALLWPLVWTGLFLVPVLPVFASPHHLYLPGVGMPLIAAAGLAALFRWRREPGRLDGYPGIPVAPVSRGWGLGVLTGAVIGKFRVHGRAPVLILLSLLLAGMTWSTGFAYVRGTLAEDLLVRDVVERDRPLAEGEHLFFINMPVLAYYAVPSIEQELGFRNLRGHVLTFAPDLIRMLEPSEVVVLDAHRLRIHCPKGNPYLSGITGSMLLGVMRMEDKIAQGLPIEAGEFTVTPTVVKPDGIHEMEFTFRDRLDSPHYHFYLGSPHFMAYPLDMKGLIRKSEVTSGE